MFTSNNIASFTSHASAQDSDIGDGRLATRKIETNNRNETETVGRWTSFPCDQSILVESREHAHVARYEKTSFGKD
jgi:hypothetical protein